MRSVSILANLVSAAVALPALASAQQVAPGDVPTISTGNTAEIFNSYGLTQPGRREQVLSSLYTVCKSNQWQDRRRCDAAWKIINAAYADLQAKRAASQVP